MDGARNAPGVRGNHARACHVSSFVGRDPKKFQPVAEAGADYRRVLSDAARERQPAQSAGRYSICAVAFLHLPTKDRNRLDRFDLAW